MKRATILSLAACALVAAPLAILAAPTAKTPPAKPATQPATKAATKAARPPAPSSTGTISGVVSYQGKAPTPSTVSMASDPLCAKSKLPSEELVVADGKLRDVHVRIKAGTAGKHKAPTSPLVIAQEGCRYSPHVAGAMVGQPIAIRNEDATMHNVHAYVDGETWFNRSQPKGAAEIRETDTGEAGEVFELKCNVHSWMRALVPISDHPFFAVSDSKGAFTIEKLPPGTYTLEAWHAKLGLKSMKIVVKAGTNKADFQFP